MFFGASTLIALCVSGVLFGAILSVKPWSPTTPPSPANTLTIYDWWTSGGDAAAMSALVNVFQSEYPNVTVIQSAVAGGAGYVLRSVIKPLVLAGEAPDAFQVHAGYEMLPYVSGGYLEPINDLWSSQGWDTVFPSVIKDMVTFSGNVYAVPVDIHRSNVMWYNKHILDANGINAASITTWDDFFAACDELDRNVTLTSSAGWSSPIALGDADGWEAAHVFEQMMAGEGIEFYQSFINGNVINPADPKLNDALRLLARYLNYTNANHESLTWDEATLLVVNGNSAFNIMGDWANAEFVIANKIYNVDYGSFPVPSTSGMYGLVVDCFEHPKGVKDPVNSLNWLRVVGSIQGQNAFNLLKGSIPARTDAGRISIYGPYQQAAIANFHSAAYLYPSIVHGSAMPESFTVEFWTIVNSFVSGSRNRDSTVAIRVAANSITQAITAYSNDFVKVWNLH